MIAENALGPTPEELVNVRNATRSCLSFRVPGQSVLLMPGQTFDLPINFIETYELNALIRQGSVIAVTAVERPSIAAKDDAVELGGDNSPQDSGVGDGSADAPLGTEAGIEG